MKRIIVTKEGVRYALPKAERKPEPTNLAELFGKVEDNISRNMFGWVGSAVAAYYHDLYAGISNRRA